MSINDFLGFDPRTTEASESFEGRQDPIPNGKYKAVATSAVRKQTKKKDGWYWEITFSVIEGEHEGKTVAHRFNMSNPSEEAVAIGRSHMRRYLDCIGTLEPKDESELCNIAVVITVGCKKDTFTNRKGEQAEGIFNEITKIDSASSEPPKAEAPAKEPSQVPPWQRRA